jgi:hypothetical protein
MFTLFIVCGTFVLADCLHVIARDLCPTRTLGNKFYDVLFVRLSSAKELFSRITSRRPIKKRENIEDSDPARSFLRVGETIDPSLPPSFPGVHSTSAMEGRVKELDFDESRRGWEDFSLFILLNSLQLDAIDAFIRNPTPFFLSFSRLTSVLASLDEWLVGLLIHYKLSPNE